MSYSRRNFLQAAGSGIVLTAVGGDAVLAAPTSLYTLPTPMVREKATFLINGKPLAAEYEARTTLWEVISMKLGLTGTNRSCNRARSQTWRAHGPYLQGRYLHARSRHRL